MLTYICHISDMERTTIYLDDSIKRYLIDISAKESRDQGKRVGMADVIREALRDYLERKGKAVSGAKSTIDRMLATKGKLGEDFEKRVKDVQTGFNEWKI